MKLTKNSKEYYVAYNASHKEEIKAYKAKYRAANREKLNAAGALYRSENKEKMKILVAAWTKNNPEKVNARARNYRSLKKNAIGRHTGEEIKVLFRLQQHCCAICGKNLVNKSYEVDHIMPLSRGGRNDKYNLQVTCLPCNRSKGGKDPIEFMQSRGKLL